MSVIKNLIRDYGDFKLDVPYWEISDVGVTALSGPSGSGKTSIIRILLGLEECPGLSWELNGVDLATLPLADRRLGIVFQNYQLFPHMTARENITFASRARQIPDAEFAVWLKDIAQALLLTNILDRKAHILSGGECQRVAIARALAGRPRFLFLDEPFSALDVYLRAEARELVKKIVSQSSIPTLLVSHDEDDIKALAQSVVRIKAGRLLH